MEPPTKGNTSNHNLAPNFKTDEKRVSRYATKKRCFKCQGVGHLQADCPNRRAIMYIGDQLIEIDSVKEEHEDKLEDDDDVEEILPDEGELLVIQRSLHVDLKKEEPWQRDTLFHTRCTSHGKVCSVIVDSGSCTNVVSDEMVKKLGLKIEKHPNPYRIHWLENSGGMKITHRCLVSFSIGKTYCDESWCDVMNMSACHLLLGRPWMFDRHVQHDGFHNTYSFTKDGHKIVLKPMHPEEFSKKPKRVELMMRSGVEDYRSPRGSVLFVKGLDSRSSLSQQGGNDVNPRECYQGVIRVHNRRHGSSLE